MSGGGFEDDELYDDQERFEREQELEHAGEKKLAEKIEEKLEEMKEQRSGSGTFASFFTRGPTDAERKLSQGTNGMDALWSRVMSK